MSDALDDFADSGNGILGTWIRENGKTGDWTYADDDMGPEPEEHFAFIVDTILVGNILFGDGKRLSRGVGRLLDGHKAPKSKADLPSPDHKPSVSLQLVFVSGPRAGELATFSGVSWGALFAVQKPVFLFRAKKRLHFPIVRLRTKPRGDINNTIDPHFEIVGWAPRSNFAELLGEDVPLMEAPATAPRLPAPVTESVPVTSSGRAHGYAAEFNPPPKPDDDLPEMIDADPSDPDNIVF